MTAGAIISASASAYINLFFIKIGAYVRGVFFNGRITALI
jgi:hypothetical protein